MLSRVVARYPIRIFRIRIGVHPDIGSGYRILDPVICMYLFVCLVHSVYAFDCLVVNPNPLFTQTDPTPSKVENQMSRINTDNKLHRCVTPLSLSFPTNLTNFVPSNLPNFVITTSPFSISLPQSTSLNVIWYLKS